MLELVYPSDSKHQTEVKQTCHQLLQNVRGIYLTNYTKDTIKTESKVIIN